MSEFALIDLIQARAEKRSARDIVLGIGDDAALLQPSADRQLVVCADTLVEGRHFFAGTDAADIGYKSLAVNLSDCAAMGGQPRWALVCLSMPAANKDWLNGFLDGFFELADRYDVQLVGGDTVSGPLSVSVQLIGEVQPAIAMTRKTARPGDEIWISGTLGDAAYAVNSLTNKADCPKPLLQRLHRPQPQVDLGQSLAGLASACIDISDGLSSDLVHLLGKHGAEILLENLPMSDHLCNQQPRQESYAYALNGGDDYELCFTANSNQHKQIAALQNNLQCSLAMIGKVTEQPGLRCTEHGADKTAIIQSGYQHFS